VLFQTLSFITGPKKNGYLLTEDPDEYLDGFGHQKFIISYPWLSAEEIRRVADEILKSYYLSFLHSNCSEESFQPKQLK